MKRFPTLERYNQIIWATIGSGVLIITLATVLIIVAALLSKLIDSNRGGVSVTLIEKQGKGESGQPPVQYNFCDPEGIYKSKYQYIRVVSNVFVVHKEMKLASSSYSYGAPTYDSCSGYGNSDRSTLVNVLIRNPESKESHLLLPKNAVIDDLEYPRGPDRTESEDNLPQFPPEGVLYLEAAFSDANGDGVIDKNDDTGAYLADIDGHNLQRITPEYSRVTGKSYDQKRNVLTLHILKDANGDHLLDDKDLDALVEVSVSERKLLGEVLNTTSLNEMMKSAEPSRTDAK